MKNNIYEEVRILANKIENTDNDIFIQNLLDSINFSSTSMEALFKIRFYLSQINEIKLSDHVLEEIKKIKDDVNKLLE